MQMEADGEAARGHQTAAVPGGVKVVVAFECEARFHQRKLAAMEIAETVAITVVTDPDAYEGFVLGNLVADM